MAPGGITLPGMATTEQESLHDSESEAHLIEKGAIMYCIINPSAGQVKYSLAADKYTNEKYARTLFRVNDRDWLNSESKVRKNGTRAYTAVRGEGIK